MMILQHKTPKANRNLQSRWTRKEYSPHDGSQGALMMEEKKTDGVVEDLLQEKQELLMKLKGLQGNVRQIKVEARHAVISPDTSIGVELQINDQDSC